MAITWIGKLITPAGYDERYIYEVTRVSSTGADGDKVIRTGNSPRISEGWTKFNVDYVKDPKNGSATGVELWDLTMLYKNSPPRQITVDICLDGKPTKTDKPTVQDGM